MNEIIPGNLYKLKMSLVFFLPVTKGSCLIESGNILLFLGYHEIAKYKYYKFFYDNQIVVQNNLPSSNEAFFYNIPTGIY